MAASITCTGCAPHEFYMCTSVYTHVHTHVKLVHATLTRTQISHATNTTLLLSVVELHKILKKKYQLSFFLSTMKGMLVYGRGGE